MLRALLITFSLAVVVAPLAASAQSSATPFLKTAPAPTVPLLGGSGLGKQDSLAVIAATNSTQAVVNALSNDHSANERDDLGRTGLIVAAINNNQVIGSILLQHGAQIDASDNLGDTALHWAADRGYADFVRGLIHRGASVNVQNRQGITPLMMAAGQGQVDVVRALLEGKADTRVADYTGRNAAGWAKNAMITRLLTTSATR